MKKIYILINSLAQGGAERVASEFGDYLQSKGFLPVYLLTDGGLPEYRLPDLAKVISLPLSGLSRGVFFFLALIVQSVYLRFKLGCDSHVVSFLHRANLVNSWSAMFSSRVVVISERSLFRKSYTGLKRRLLYFLIKSAYRRANRVIAISELVRLELDVVFGVKGASVVVLNNPINFSHFNSIGRKSSLCPNNVIRFCSVGRFVASKRFELVLLLFKRISEYFPKSELHLYGDGPERTSLERRAAELDVAEYTYFHGKVSNVGDVLRECHVFLFTSEYESFGNVGIEALACGLPVIYTQNLLSFDEIFYGSSFLACSIDESMGLEAIEKSVAFLNGYNREISIKEMDLQLKRFDASLVFAKYLDQVFL